LCGREAGKQRDNNGRLEEHLDELRIGLKEGVEKKASKRAQLMIVYERDERTGVFEEDYGRKVVVELVRGMEFEIEIEIRAEE
jgi:hypothetical protein